MSVVLMTSNLFDEGHQESGTFSEKTLETGFPIETLCNHRNSRSGLSETTLVYKGRHLLVVRRGTGQGTLAPPHLGPQRTSYFLFRDIYKDRHSSK